jgi:hypothetical protein
VIRNSDWPTRIGWAVFVVLTVTTLVGYYIFDPFIFGAAYYILYQFNHLPSASEENKRVLLLGTIGLLYVFFHFLDEVEEKRFERKLESICLNSQSAEEGICADVSAALDSSKISLGSNDD